MAGRTDTAIPQSRGAGRCVPNPYLTENDSGGIRPRGITRLHNDCLKWYAES